MKQDLEAGFRAVAEQQLPGLRRFAHALARDPHRGDDLVSSALERLYVAWPRAHGVSSPGAYLRTTVVRLAVSESRRPWRRERPSEVLPETGALAGCESAPGSDLRMDLTRALAVLTVKQRAIVVLRYLEDRSVAEVADILGIAPGTVKRQAFDAVATLRRTLGEDFLDDGPLEQELRSGHRPGPAHPAGPVHPVHDCVHDLDPCSGGTR